MIPGLLNRDDKECQKRGGAKTGDKGRGHGAPDNGVSRDAQGHLFLINILREPAGGYPNLLRTSTFFLFFLHSSVGAVIVQSAFWFKANLALTRWKGAPYV